MWSSFILRFKFLSLYNQVLCLYLTTTRDRNSGLHCIFSVEAKNLTSFIQVSDALKKSQAALGW